MRWLISIAPATGPQLTREQVEEIIAEAAKLDTIAYDLERPALMADTRPTCRDIRRGRSRGSRGGEGRSLLAAR